MALFCNSWDLSGGLESSVHLEGPVNAAALEGVPGTAANVILLARTFQPRSQIYFKPETHSPFFQSKGGMMGQHI
jgi:hypothetical protein